jgi:hypothetical protein
MGNSCTSCKQQIIWDKVAREKLNTKRPLNPDYTIHSCGFLIGGNGSDASNPTTAVVKTISPTNTTIPKIESLNQINFAEIIAEILQDYLRLKRQEVGAGKN